MELSDLGTLSRVLGNTVVFMILIENQYHMEPASGHAKDFFISRYNDLVSRYNELLSRTRYNEIKKSFARPVAGSILSTVTV